LLFGEAGEMRGRAVVPAEGVAGVLAAPAEQARAPGDGAVHEALLFVIPDGVCGDAEGRGGGVDEGVGCFDGDAAGNGVAAGLGEGELFGQIGGAENRESRVDYRIGWRG